MIVANIPKYFNCLRTCLNIAVNIAMKGLKEVKLQSINQILFCHSKDDQIFLQRICN